VQSYGNHNERLEVVKYRAQQRRGRARIETTEKMAENAMPEDMKERLRALGYLK